MRRAPSAVWVGVGAMRVRRTQPASPTRARSTAPPHARAHPPPPTPSQCPHPPTSTRPPARPPTHHPASTHPPTHTGSSCAACWSALWLWPSLGPRFGGRCGWWRTRASRTTCTSRSGEWVDVDGRVDVDGWVGERVVGGRAAGERGRVGGWVGECLCSSSVFAASAGHCASLAPHPPPHPTPPSRCAHTARRRWSQEAQSSAPQAPLI